MKFSQAFARRGYLYKTVLTVVFISILPMMVISIVTYTNILHSVNSEIITANERLLLLTNNAIESIIQQVQNNCRLLKDDYVFKNFHAIEKPVEWFETNRDYKENQTLKELYDYISTKGKIFDRLSAEKMGSAFIQSVYFIDYKKDVVITSDREIIPQEQFYDDGLWDVLSSQVVQLGMVERSAKDKFGVSQEVLSVYYGLRQQGESQVFVINLLPQDFYAYLSANLFSNSQGRIMAIKDHRAVLSRQELQAEQMAPIYAMLQNWDKEAMFATQTALDDGTYYVTGIYSQRLHWWTVSLTRTRDLFRAQNRVYSVFSFVLVALTTLVMAAILLWAIYWYKPISKIVDSLRGDRQGEKNEMRFIHENIQWAYQQWDSLEKKVEQMLPVYKERYMHALLTGKGDSGQEIWDKLAYLHVPLNATPFRVAALQLKNLFGVEDNEIASSVAQSMRVEGLIAKAFQPFTKQYFTMQDVVDRYVIVLNVSPQQTTQMFACIERLVSDVVAELRVSCSVGISSAQAEISDLHDAYTQAQQALSHAVFVPANSIVDFGDIQLSDASANPKTIQPPAALFTAIRAGKEQAAISILGEYFQTLLKGYPNLSRAKINDIFLRLLSKLFDIVEELNLRDEEMYRVLNDVTAQLIHHNEVAAVEGIEVGVRHLTSICRERMESKDDSRVAQMLAIIASDYARKDLSLSNVAERVELNPDYLTRVFKDKTGKTFIEHLTAIRLQRSVELLYGTHMKIKDIAEAVG